MVRMTGRIEREDETPGLRSADRLWIIAGFLALSLLYIGDGHVQPGNDAKANVYLPIALLEGHSLGFAPERFPFMFEWRARVKGRERHLSFADWDRAAAGTTLRDLYSRGWLEVIGPKYYLVPGAHEDRYVNTFGPGAGIAAFPIYALFWLASDDFAEEPARVLLAGKIAASLMVSASAVFVFLTCLEITGRRRSFIIACVYALGTCVWSIASQTLWQHGPALFYVSLGILFLFRGGETRRNSVLAGLALGAAVLCRPSSVLIVLAFAFGLLASDRRRFVAFSAGVLPMALLTAGYNFYYLGSPFVFAQSLVAPTIAATKLGSSNPWDTSLLEGAAGLLVSPSRGLFVYSPILLLALPGFARAWRHPRSALFRPLAIGLLGVLLLGFKWLDWWGGWSFGYRHIVDAMPLWVLFLIPSLDALESRFAPGTRGRSLLIASAALLLAWSIGVQALGAFCYDVIGWNAKQIEGVVADIDQPRFRYRLWSLTDSPLVYYLTNTSEARTNRKKIAEAWSRSPQS